MQKVLVSVLFSNWRSSLHGGGAPHSLFRREKRMRRARWKRKALCVQIPPLAGLDKYVGPNKRLWAVEASSSVGRGHGLAEIYKCVARDELLPCVGLENRFGLLLFPLPLPLIPGSAKRSEERGKRSRGHTSATPESLSHAPKCGEAPSLFPKGTAHPVGDSQLTGAPSRTTLVLVQTCPNGQVLDTKAPFLLTVNGRFLFGATEKKMGVHSQRRKAAQSPCPRPMGRPKEGFPPLWGHPSLCANRHRRPE